MIRAIFGTEQKLESARTLDCGRELHPFVNVSVLHICSFTKMFSYGTARQETCSSYDYKTELHTDLAPNSNGQIDQPVTTLGATAIYTCNTGFVLSGMSNRVCTESGGWSDEAPVCDRKFDLKLCYLKC